MKKILPLFLILISTTVSAANYRISFHDKGLKAMLPAPPKYASCKAILDASQSKGDGYYDIYPNGNSQPSVHAYCDMTTAGGGWTMWYTSNNYYHLADSPNSGVSYGTPGYSVDLRKLPFTQIMYVRNSDNAKDWFSEDSASPIVVNNYITTGGVLNVGGQTFGTWTGHGGADTSYQYQLVIGDKTWMQVGLMISSDLTNYEYYGTNSQILINNTYLCWKKPNDWCGDNTSSYSSRNFYRLDGEGNGVQDTGSFGGVAFRENGHQNVSFRTISVGVR